MALKIIAGKARGIILDTPDTRSMRPTSGRAREALFSSLGDLTGLRFADVFAGSGAIGLEAASRGAAEVVLLEGDVQHVKLIERNVAKLRKAGVDSPIEVLRRKAVAGSILNIGSCDVWFFDPPYAESGDYLKEFAANAAVRELWRNSLIIWEMPDTAEARAVFQNIPELYEHFDCRVKNLGSCDFLICRSKENTL